MASLGGLAQQAGQPAFVRTANLPMDAEGRVYHLKVKRGEVANRVLSVGDPNRAAMLAHMLDSTEPSYFKTVSNRGFTIYTGLFEGVPVSIIATGMGIAMIDFVVRESRAIVDGPMVIIRFGTCGTPRPDVEVGSLIVASKGSVEVIRNPDGFSEDPTKTTVGDCYKFTKPIPADPTVSATLVSTVKSEFEKQGQEITVVEGLNATADTFYASQGRSLPQFDDRNSEVVDSLLKQYPELSSLEMESFHLFDLARCSFGSVRAGAACIAVAQRARNRFIDEKVLHEMEHRVGRSILKALISIPLPEPGEMSGPECVWTQMKKTEESAQEVEEKLQEAVHLLSRQTRTLSFSPFTPHSLPPSLDGSTEPK